MSKTTAFILLVIFSLGFTVSFYAKYIKKDYVQGIEIAVKTNDNEYISRKLNLNQAIAFLDNLEETKSTFGINAVEGDENAKVLKRLKAINILSVSGMMVFFFLSILVVFKLRKSTKQTLPLKS